MQENILRLADILEGIQDARIKEMQAGLEKVWRKVVWRVRSYY